MRSSYETKHGIILLVEDNSGDVRLVHEAFSKSKPDFTIFDVEDGEAAIRFLRKEDEYEEAPTPDLIILDLNLPRMNGREVLSILKADNALRKIPVVVLSSSSSNDDISTSYDLHANCYITKPAILSEFFSAVTSIGNFWFQTVALPKS